MGDLHLCATTRMVLQHVMPFACAVLNSQMDMWLQHRKLYTFCTCSAVLLRMSPVSQEYQITCLLGGLAE